MKIRINFTQNGHSQIGVVLDNGRFKDARVKSILVDAIRGNDIVKTLVLKSEINNSWNE